MENGKREIKFRAWLPKTGEMKAPFWLTALFYMNEIAIGGLINDGEACDVIFLQYAGLIDKNGREIYEGDILAMNIPYRNFPGDDLHYQAITTEVSFSSGAFWFRGGGRTDCNWFHYEPEDREVIGNIYENPELLQQH